VGAVHSIKSGHSVEAIPQSGALGSGLLAAPE
jgi:hypothetical protein